MHDSLKTASDIARAGILADMPRRQLIEATIGDASLSQMRFVTFKVNHFRSIASLFRWYQVLIYFGLHILGDILLGRDARKRRAVWLRRGPWGVIAHEAPEAHLVVGSLAELVERIDDAWPDGPRPPAIA